MNAYRSEIDRALAGDPATYPIGAVDLMIEGAGSANESLRAEADGVSLDEAAPIELLRFLEDGWLHEELERLTADAWSMALMPAASWAWPSVHYPECARAEWRIEGDAAGRVAGRGRTDSRTLIGGAVVARSESQAMLPVVAANSSFNLHDWRWLPVGTVIDLEYDAELGRIDAAHL